MRAIVAILSATLAGAVLLQSYFAIWHPSSFGRFAEFPILLLYSACIVTAAFLVLVVPGFFLLRRAQRRLAWPVGFIVGLLLGCLVMLLFMALFQWPMRLPELVAGSISGAVGVAIYARLTSKAVA
jgi:hypothetical protein